MNCKNCPAIIKIDILKNKLNANIEKNFTINLAPEIMKISLELDIHIVKCMKCKLNRSIR